VDLRVLRDRSTEITKRYTLNAALNVGASFEQSSDSLGHCVVLVKELHRIQPFINLANIRQRSC